MDRCKKNSGEFACLVRLFWAGMKAVNRMLVQRDQDRLRRRFSVHFEVDSGVVLLWCEWILEWIQKLKYC